MHVLETELSQYNYGYRIYACVFQQKSLSPKTALTEQPS